MPAHDDAKQENLIARAKPFVDAVVRIMLDLECPLSRVKQTYPERRRMAPSSRSTDLRFSPPTQSPGIVRGFLCRHHWTIRGEVAN
jgi:hypothetical protein